MFTIKDAIEVLLSDPENLEGFETDFKDDGYIDHECMERVFVHRETRVEPVKCRLWTPLTNYQVEPRLFGGSTLEFFRKAHPARPIARVSQCKSRRVERT